MMHSKIANPSMTSPKLANAKLESLLNDPITQLVMRRDGITADQVRTLVTCVSQSRRSGAGVAPLSY